MPPPYLGASLCASKGRSLTWEALATYLARFLIAPR